jgi:hypothetical protein
MTFDFDAAVLAPFRMQPGLRRLAPGARQLTPSLPGGAHLREKLQVLSLHAPRALQAQPGFDAGPALAGLCAHAAREHPHAWAVAGGAWRAPLLGWSVQQGVVHDEGGAPAIGACLHALPGAWRAPALLALAFEEDFAIVDAASGTIAWLAVALPSHWAPQDKVGRHFTEVHAPVADNSLLLAAGERLLKLVAGAESWERFVWGITPHATLNTHPAVAGETRWQPAAADGASVAEAAWWRTERQTFLPTGSGQAVFTIHVELTPLTEAIDSPQRAARVADALASMSDAVLAYRHLTEVREPLLAWLRNR